MKSNKERDILTVEQNDRLQKLLTNIRNMVHIDGPLNGLGLLPIVDSGEIIASITSKNESLVVKESYLETFLEDSSMNTAIYMELLSSERSTNILK